MIDQKILRDALWLANNAWKAKEKEIEYLGAGPAAYPLDCAVAALIKALADRNMAVGPKFCPHEKYVMLDALRRYFDTEEAAAILPQQVKDDFHRGGWTSGWRLLAKLRSVWTDNTAGVCNCYEKASDEGPDMVWPPDHVRRGLRADVRLEARRQPIRSTKSVLIIPGSLDQESGCSHQSILRRENFAPGDIIDVPEELGGGRAVVGPDATSEIAHCVCGQMIWSAFPLTRAAQDLGENLAKYLVIFVDEDATAQYNDTSGQKGAE